MRGPKLVEKLIFSEAQKSGHTYATTAVKPLKIRLKVVLSAMLVRMHLLHSQLVHYKEYHM